MNRTSDLSALFKQPLRVLDVGGKDGSRARTEFYPGADVTVVDLENGWDVMEDGLPNGDWDVILANHSIEHFSNPDHFLEECKRIMKPGTILNIGTPNLAAWFNRILFLAGYVPHSMELSTRYNVGKAFNWNQEELGGHIYVYSVSALSALLRHHGFTITSVAGEYSTYPSNSVVRFVDRMATGLSPSLASAFRIKCTI